MDSQFFLSVNGPFVEYHRAVTLTGCILVRKGYEMTRCRRLPSLAALAVLTAVTATAIGAHSAKAATFGFEDIDGSGQGPTFASQVSLDVVDTGSSTVGFKITMPMVVSSVSSNR